MNSRLKDASKLIKSKCYILITDKEGVMSGDFRGFTAIMKLHTLKQMQENLQKMITKLSKPKRGKNGR